MGGDDGAGLGSSCSIGAKQENRISKLCVCFRNATMLFLRGREHDVTAHDIY